MIVCRGFWSKHPAGTARAEAGSAVSLREVLGFLDVRHRGEPVKHRLTLERAMLPNGYNSVVVITTAQQGAFSLVPQSRRWTRRTVSQLASTRRQLDQKARQTSGILVEDRSIDTGVFQPRYLVHELVFACSPPPAAAPQGQPSYPDSRRIGSQSSRPWRQVFECSGTNSKSGHGAHAQLCAHEGSQSSQHVSQPTAAVSLKHGTQTQCL